MTRAPSSGFTLIEVIIAMAIAAVMVVAVQSATQAMTRTARKQTESATEEARFQRCIEILRRDLRGWYPNKTNGAVGSIQKVGEDKVLLRFTTTTDSLSAASSNGSTVTRSISQLQYVSRAAGTEFQLIRIEMPAAGGTSNLVIWHGRSEPQFTFYQPNQGWVMEWSLEDRPSCIHIALNGNGITLAP